MASASKKTYTTEEVSQKIFKTDDKDFLSDIVSEDSVEDEEVEEPCNRVSIYFVDKKDVNFDANTGGNANDNDVADDDFFVTIFIFFNMIMMSSNHCYILKCLKVILLNFPNMYKFIKFFKTVLAFY